MPNRIQKRYTTYKEINNSYRATLIEAVYFNGDDSKIPYTRCYRAGYIYRISDDSRYYVTYIKARKVYDSNNVASYRAFFSRGVSLRANSGIVTRAISK